jgi:hypothetical protein
MLLGNFSYNQSSIASFNERGREKRMSNSKKIALGLGALALAGGAGYGGYKGYKYAAANWGKNGKKLKKVVEKVGEKSGNVKAQKGIQKTSYTNPSYRILDDDVNIGYADYD